MTRPGPRSSHSLTIRVLEPEAFTLDRDLVHCVVVSQPILESTTRDAHCRLLDRECQAAAWIDKQKQMTRAQGSSKSNVFTDSSSSEGTLIFAPDLAREGLLVARKGSAIVPISVCSLGPRPGEVLMPLEPWGLGRERCSPQSIVRVVVVDIPLAEDCGARGHGERERAQAREEDPGLFLA